MPETTIDPTPHAISQALAVAEPTELRLEPIEGLARWLGPLLPLALRLVSMIEQPRETMSGPLSPVKGYFRRDRFRHPRVDPETYRLDVTGVAQPRSFTLAALRRLPVSERVLVMECAGNGNHVMGSAGLLGQARWTGVSLDTLLEVCGGPGPASHFAFHGLDPVPLVRRGYHYGLALSELAEARALVAYEMNGEPLPRPRGFPVRLVVPGIYSMSHVKWLGRIEGKTSPHDGFYNHRVFVNKERRDGRWVKVQARWIGLKSMITRCQRSPTGWTLTGWAWGGRDPVSRVDVTVDGGKTWSPARVQSAAAYFGPQGIEVSDLEHAWAVFEYDWHAPSRGPYRVACRAYTETAAQPMKQDPNVHGHFDQTRVKWRRVRVP